MTTDAELRKKLEPYRREDPVLDRMMRRGIPLTRAHYIDIAYIDGPPKHWNALHEEEIPEPLQDWSKVKST